MMMAPIVENGSDMRLRSIRDRPSHFRFSSMKHSLLPGLLVLSMATALPQAAHAAQDAAATSIRVGTPVRGEITTAHRINYSDGSRSLVYAIDLEAGQAVRFETSGALCARLTVLHEGETVAGPSTPACEGGDGTGSQLSMMAVDPGRYEVAVSGAGHRAFGPFRLEAKALQVHRGDAPLQVGSDIVDFLRGDERVYRLDIRQSGYYVIDMRSGELDSMLELQGNGVSISDDDGGDGLDARIRVPLDTGAYTLRAKSLGSTPGMFQLSVGTGALPPGVRLQNSGALPPDGSTLHGVLGGTPREYQLRVTRPSRVTIDLGSDDFDTVLELRGNGVSLENDDGGDGTNSRLSTALQPGTYRVIARGLQENASGLFTLSAQRRDLPSGDALRSGGALPLDTPLTGMASGAAHTYQLEVAQPGRLVVDMTSDDFDTVLELHRDGSKIVEDDDGGDGTNARLSADVQPGLYSVVARSYSDGAGGGLYELTARLTATDAAGAPAIAE